MNVRRKIVVILALMNVFLVVVLSTVAGVIIVREARRNEGRQTRQWTQHVVDAVNTDLARLRDMTADYAIWDDSYAFVQGHKEDFVEANLSDDACERNRFGVIVFADAAGNIVFSKGFDLKANRAADISADVLDYLRQNHLLMRASTPGPASSGVVALPKEILLLAAHPLLTSRRTGPAAGTLVIGHEIESVDVGASLAPEGIRLTYQRLDGDGVDAATVDEVRARPRVDPVLVKVREGQRMGGFALVRDVSGRPVVMVCVDVPRRLTLQAFRYLRTGVVVIALAGAAGAIVFMVLFNRLILARLLRLSGFVRGVQSSRDLSGRLSLPDGDELAELAAAINGMLDRLGEDIAERRKVEEDRRGLEMQIRHVEKLKSLGILAGGIAHDFNNILMGILGHASLASASATPGSREAAAFLEIEKAANRAADLCRQMLAYAGKGHLSAKPLDVRRLIDEMRALIGISISKKATVEFHFEPDLPLVKGDASQMQQVVMNLLTNASEALGDRNGRIGVEVGSLQFDQTPPAGAEPDGDLALGRYVFIRVSDTGVGMDEATCRRVFEPFFSTKFAGRGLGLSAAMGFVRSHRGTIKVESRPGSGSRFTVFLPAMEETRPTPVDRPPTTIVDAWRGRGTVLLADDEDLVRKPARLMLEKLGFKVITAVDGWEAVEILRRIKESGAAAEGDGVVAVILDVTMPRMGGVEVLRHIRQIDPGLPVIFSSGYDGQDVAGQFPEGGASGFVQKPYTLEGLTTVIRRAVESAARPG